MVEVHKEEKASSKISKASENSFIVKIMCRKTIILLFN